MSERLSITPLGPYIGAQITGADLTRPLSDNQSTLVAAELIAATRGLGFMVQSAGEFLATDVVLAGIAVIAIIAFLLELGLRALQRRLTPWHGEVQ